MNNALRYTVSLVLALAGGFLWWALYPTAPALDQKATPVMLTLISHQQWAVAAATLALVAAALVTAKDGRPEMGFAPSKVAALALCGGGLFMALSAHSAAATAFAVEQVAWSNLLPSAFVEWGSKASALLSFVAVAFGMARTDGATARTAPATTPPSAGTPPSKGGTNTLSLVRGGGKDDAAKNTPVVLRGNHPEGQHVVVAAPLTTIRIEAPVHIEAVTHIGVKPRVDVVRTEPQLAPVVREVVGDDYPPEGTLPADAVPVTAAPAEAAPDPAPEASELASSAEPPASPVPVAAGGDTSAPDSSGAVASKEEAGGNATSGPQQSLPA